MCQFPTFPSTPSPGPRLLRTLLPVLLWTGLAGAEPPSSAARTAHGYLGVTVTEICPEVRAQTSLREGEGLMIGRVAPDSPASRTGLSHYDILTRFNDQWLMSPAQFVTLVENAGPDAEIGLTYLRKGAELRTNVRLSCPPPRPVAVEPLPEQLLSNVIRALRGNPDHLREVHRYLAASARGAQAALLPVKNGSRFTLLDPDGELELLVVDNYQQLQAWDNAGVLLFKGACNTPADHERIPPELLPRLELLRKQCRASHRRSTPQDTAPVPAGESAEARKEIPASAAP